MKQVQLFLFFIVIFLFSGFIPVSAFDQYESMNVGETKTFYFPSEVASRAGSMYAYNCYSDHINQVEVVSYTSTSVTVKAIAYIPSTVNVIFDYWWYENNDGRHDTHMVGIDLNGDNGSSTSGNDYNPANYTYDHGAWGTITIEEGETKTVYCQYEISSGNESKVKSILWSDYEQPHGYDIISQNSNTCTIKGQWAYSGILKLYCLMKYGNSTIKAYYNIIVKESSKERLKLDASPSGGEVQMGTIVTLTSSQSNSYIYYTLDGTNPTRNSVNYTSSGIVINEPCTLKAFASKSGYTDSPVMTWIYKIINGTPVTGITLSPTSATLEVGDTKQLTAIISPSNATNKSVTWSSSNSSVATVNSSGLVTAESVGSATITCSANDGSGVSNTCNVTVEIGDGYVFKDKTSEGIEMTFTVISAKNKTCQVGIDNYDVTGMSESSISKSTTGTITIPSTTNGYKVVGIGGNAFYECIGIDKVVIPTSITSIGEYNQEIKGVTNVEIIPVSA